MKPFLMLSLTSLWAVIALGGGQSTNPYRSASANLSPVQTSRRGQGGVQQNSAPASSATGAASGPGGQRMTDLLQTFDKYLLNNLEQTYYRLSYAFKDATKRTLDKCGCANP